MENLKQVLDFLNRNKLRASYRDVAGVLGLTTGSLFEMLETQRPDACWVVNEETGKPSGYTEAESDPELRSHDIISDEDDLRAKMQVDKLSGRPRRAPGLKSSPTLAPAWRTAPAPGARSKSPWRSAGKSRSPILVAS
jgi:hypothetical protein